MLKVWWDFFFFPGGGGGGVQTVVGARHRIGCLNPLPWSKSTEIFKQNYHQLMMIVSRQKEIDGLKPKV